MTQLQSLFTKFENQINEIETAKKDPNSSTARQLYLARATFNTLSTSLKNLERTAEIYSTDSSKFLDVSKNEKAKRIQKVTDFGERFKRLANELNQLESGGSNDIETGINK